MCILILYPSFILSFFKRVVFDIIPLFNPCFFLKYGKMNTMLILKEIFIIQKILFILYFSWSKLVRQCFVELLCRMTKIRFLHLNYFFFVNVYIGQFVVNETNICLRLSPVS